MGGRYAALAEGHPWDDRHRTDLRRWCRRDEFDAWARWAAPGELSGHELIQIVGKLSVVAFLVGVVFSGVLAVTARGRPFDRLSLRYVTALGAGGGLLYFLFIAAMNGARVWSASAAIANLTILILLGGGSAAGTLILARRAGHALQSGDESRSLDDG